MKNNSTTRRFFVKSSAFGMLAVAIPNVMFSKEEVSKGVISKLPSEENKLFYRYPSINDSVVYDVVGKSHYDLKGVKKLVDVRPELARATWDWNFGDWESAIGAASHVGRRDIVEYLISKGARPTMFTYAMLGAYNVVKAIIDMTPGIQKIYGPHGTSLLHHAQAGMRMKSVMSSQQVSNSEKLIAYLQDLGDAGGKTYLRLSETDNQKYLGDYKYGDGEKDGFTVELNMRKMISLGKLGKSGGSLLKIGNNKFLYNGVTSVTITFQVEKNTVKSLTVIEPNLTLVAKKI